MTTILATIVIIVSAIINFYLLTTIFVCIFYDIPITKKLDKHGYITRKGIINHCVKSLVVCFIIFVFLCSVAYLLFQIYGFGFSVSYFIGVVIGLIMVLWKLLNLRSFNNYTRYLDYYRKMYKQYISTYDISELYDVITGKEGEFDRNTEKMINKII